ncbi:AAA family ATPase, partial [Acidocella aminolytica]
SRAAGMDAVLPLEDELFEDAPEFAKPALPPECEALLGWQMTQSALKPFNFRLPLGFYVVLVHDQSWVSVVAEMLRTVYVYGPYCRPDQVDAPPIQRPNIQLLGARTPITTVKIPRADDANNTTSRVSIEARIAKFLGEGTSACFVTSDLSELPTPLQAMADRVIEVPAPSRRFLRAMLRKIAPPHGRLDYRGLDCAGLTPTMLSLAYRNGTSAQGYLQRLHRLLATGQPQPLARQSKPITPLSALHGVDDAKSWANELKADLGLYRAAKLTWDDVPSSALFNGPSGTGKTSLAQAIAEDCQLNFIGTSYSDWQSAGSGHLGDVIRTLRAAFAEARARRPSVLFIDELDSIGTRKAGSAQREEWWRVIINALLEEMDGRADNEGVVLLAASNHPEAIDPAILRSGRLDRHIAVALPTASALAAIYHDQLATSPHDGTLDFAQLGDFSAGLTGADVKKHCADARRRARLAKRPLTQADVIQVITGEESSASPDDLWRIAVHECGHAIAAYNSPALEVGMLSILRRGDIAGSATFKLRSSHVTADSLHAYLIAMLAGRAAEEVLLGQVSSGAGGPEGSDLSRATRLAAEAEFSLGLGEDRLAWLDLSQPGRLTSLLTTRPDVERLIATRIRDAYAAAKALIEAQQQTILRLAQCLLKARVMSSADIQRFVGEVRCSSVIKLPLATMPRQTIH